MTLKSEAKLLEICDLFASGFTYSDCARISGVAPRTLFMWLRNSAANSDESLIIPYMGEEMQFAQAMALARKVLHMQVRSALETRSALGHDEPIFFQGRPSWVEDERCVGIDDPDVREMMGYARDGYLRDEQGRRVQHTIHHEPPIAAALRVLEMSFNEEYTPSSNINVVNSDTGVAVGAPITGEKLTVPSRPARPALPAPTVEPDADYTDLLGPAPNATPATDTDPAAPPTAPPIQPEDRVDPGPMIPETTPAEYSPRRSLSPEELALLARLPADRRSS